MSTSARRNAARRLSASTSRPCAAPRARVRATPGTLVLGAGLALVAAPGAASAAYCPCYTASSPNNDHGCAIEAKEGTNPTVAEWNGIFDLVSQGPSAWGDQGPTVGDIGQGCGKPEPLHDVPARFPCELLKAIATTESGWKQFCVPTLPADQVGGPSRTIISFDCGYGIGQVTSGMHVGETPDFDRDRVASDPIYNLATGTRILAGKWKATNCVGDNQPKIIEHWYTSTWAYNGLAYVNNPSNPNYDPNRGVWNPAVGGSAPYQEKVFGFMEHPAFDGVDAVAPAYPNPGDVGSSGSPPDLPDPSCASPTDCANTRALHPTACVGQAGSGGAGGAAGGAGGTTGQGGSALGGAPVGTGGGPAGGQAGGGVGGGVGASGGEGGGGGLGDDTIYGSCDCRIGSTGGETESRTGLLLATLGLGLFLSRRRRG